MTQSQSAFVRSYAQINLTEPAQVWDEQGEVRTLSIACERALTLYLNKREIVTLMTLGAEPEALVLGYLRNQGMITGLDKVVAIQVDWEVESAVVVAAHDPKLEEKLQHKTVTTGCGQGTQYGALMADLDQVNLTLFTVRQRAIYQLLSVLNEHNETYRSAGAVHGCALCTLPIASEAQAQVLAFSEDVGRHNAVDTLAGKQWLNNLFAEEMVFYTTGRLTSEMVIKVARMGISVLLSRSGVTEMGLKLAQKLGIMLIARAKGRHFLIYSGQERFIWDEKPSLKPNGAKVAAALEAAQRANAGREAPA